MRRPRSLSLVATWALACAAGCTEVNPIFGLTPWSADADVAAGGTGGGGGTAGTASGDAAGAGGVTTEPADGRIDESDRTPLPDASTGGVEVGADANDTQPADVAQPDAPLTGTLVAYWNFEDGSGSSAVLDRSGNGNHGVLEGLSTTKAWVTGHAGTGLEFPPEVAGAESGVRVALTSRLDALRTFTLAAWMKRQIKNSPGLWTIISRQRDNTIDEIFNLTSSQANVEAFIPAAGGVTSAAKGAVPNIDGRWIHVAATYDGQALRVYADGAEVASAQWPDRLRSSTTPIYIGTNKNAGRSEPFEGVLDDVVICDKALPAADIKALFQGASPFNYR